MYNMCVCVSIYSASYILPKSLSSVVFSLLSRLLSSVVFSLLSKSLSSVVFSHLDPYLVLDPFFPERRGAKVTAKSLGETDEDLRNEGLSGLRAGAFIIRKGFPSKESF